MIFSSEDRKRQLNRCSEQRQKAYQENKPIETATIETNVTDYRHLLYLDQSFEQIDQQLLMLEENARYWKHKADRGDGFDREAWARGSALEEAILRIRGVMDT